MRNCSLPTLHSHLAKLLVSPHNMNYPRKNTIYLTQFYTSTPRLTKPLKYYNEIIIIMGYNETQ